MKNVLPCLLIVLASWRSENTNQNYSLETVKQSPATSAEHFLFINKMTEQVGNNTNTMELFSVVGKLEPNALKQLCSNRKKNFRTGTFFFIVIFDDKLNASFPSDPFTAEYGIEEKKMKHIKAFYTYNRINRYSKLQIYTKNMFESSGDEIDI